MKFIQVLLFFFSFQLALAQSILTDSIAQLQPPLEESSGLTILGNRIITIGDSGNPPALFEIDSISGTASRTVYVANATNVDWEALAMDTSFIYIGDFGNNNGTRQDLKIYKVALADYLNTPNDTVMAETISFSYADQTSFAPAPFQTNYDAEALVSFGDSLYIFTKQWSKPGTTVYPISKTTGTYIATKKDSLEADGLVTGGAYSFYFNTLVLTTNTPTGPNAEIYYFWQPGGGYARITRLLVVSGSIQVEAVANRALYQFYFTSETGLAGDGVLSRADIPPIGIDEYRQAPVHFFPNPSAGTVYLQNLKHVQSVEVLDMQGKQIFHVKHPEISEFTIQQAGQYVMRIQFESGESVSQVFSIVR